MLHTYNSNILMADFSIVPAINIKTGDKLLSENGKISIAENISVTNEAYQITTKNNQLLYADLESKLVLSPSVTKYSERNCYPTQWVGSLKDFFNKSKTFHHLYKLQRRGINFPNSTITIDPYFLGILLGDGGIVHGINVTTMDDIIITECQKQTHKYNLKIRTTKNNGTKAVTYHLHVDNQSNQKNYLLSDLRKLQLFGTKCNNKFIPPEYKITSAINRLDILAGLLDTDGHKTCNTYDFISKSQKLAGDVCFIARSLGFQCSLSKCEKSSQNGTKGNYYRLNISGNTDIIPVRLPHKKCTPRQQKKNHQRTGFDISKVKGKFLNIRTNNTYFDDNFIILR